jgi:rhomboid protease GluP
MDAPTETPHPMYAFSVGMRDRRLIATPVLIVTILIVYGLEFAFDAESYMPAMMRLGALQRDAVLSGEVWRLVTSTFLHGSIMHLFFNVYVLYSLGSTLERLLGTSRFVVLYLASGLGGALLSLVFLEGTSVGASGALWGLMAAEFLLAIRGEGILPEPLRVSLRNGAGQNLVLNVLNSFRPGVDWAAHAGGGIVGIAFALLGLLTLGLPRWAGLSPLQPVPRDQVPGFMKVGAWISAGVLAVGLLGGLALGRVWDAKAGPTLARVTLGNTGFSADIPVGLVAQPPPQEVEMVYGDFLRDPALVDVLAVPFDVKLSAEEIAAAYNEAEPDLSTMEAGFSIESNGRIEVDGHTVAFVRARGPNGTGIERSLVVTEAGMTRVDVLYWKAAAPEWHTIGRSVAASVAPVP